MKYVRIYSYCIFIFQIYLTSKLTCLAMRSDFSIETNAQNNQEVTMESRCDNGGSAGEQSDDAASEAEYDELFNKMQVVGSKICKKRKLVKSAKEVSSNDRNVVSRLATISSHKRAISCIYLLRYFISHICIILSFFLRRCLKI